MKYDIRNFTLEEKINMLTGYAHGMQTYGIEGKLPFMWMSDGPHGLRYIDTSTGVMFTRKATAYPSAEVMASSWNPKIVEKVGLAIGDECVENDVAVLLAPGVNIKRVPTCGRNFEYYSEDPLLSGIMGASFIKGVQSKGVGTSLKHFVANNREYDRMSQNSEMDERTLHEIYMKPFEIALEAKPWTVMNSYNAVNGVFMSENKKLLSYLREKLGFDGLIVSDWGSVKNRVKSIKAGVDVEMPYCGERTEQIKQALSEGRLTEKDIDECVRKLLELAEKYTDAAHLRKVTLSDEARREVALECAREGIVLLKNDDNVLPLKAKDKILVCGDVGNCACIGGGGSSKVEIKQGLPSLKDEIEKLYDGEVWHESGHYYTEGVPFFHKMKNMFERALWADTVIVAVGDTGLQISEAFDRPTLKLYPVYEELIKKVSSYNKNVVVVLESGGAVDCSEWKDCVNAIVYAGFGGEMINKAVAEVVTGKINPSGKLAETFINSMEDCYVPVYPRSATSDFYSEGVFVGYRYYDTFDKPVCFPFGFGLSYSKFEYSDLKITKLSDCKISVEYMVKNISSVAGAEISQVYVGHPLSMVGRPKKELAAFSKNYLEAGESKRVRLEVDEKAFRYYNVSLDKWIVEGGVCYVYVGSSSADIRLTEKVELPHNDDEPSFV